MRIPTLVLLCFLLLSMTALPIAAQDDTGKTIYIYAEINRDQLADTPQFTLGQSHNTPQFFKRLGEVLIAEGLNPVFITPGGGLQDGSYPDFFQSSDDIPFFFDEYSLWVDIRLTSTVDWIYLSPYAAFEHPPLPSGTFGWSSVPTVDPLRDEAVEGAVNVAVGLALYVANECEAAIPYLEQALEDADFVDDGLFVTGTALFYRANCEYSLGNEDTAIELYNTILEDDSQIPSGFDPLVLTDYAAMNLAWIYAMTDRAQEAETLLDAYTDPVYTSYTSREMLRFLDRAAVYRLLEEDEKAISELTRIIDLITGEVSTESLVSFAPDETARLYTERGWLYAETGKKSQAFADYEKAMETDSSYPKAYYRRGLLYLENEDEDAAFEDLEQFLTLEPAFYDYYEEDLAPFVAEAQALIEN